MANFSDTICAPATSVGTGAVSLIRISGPESAAVVDRVVRFRSGTAAQAPGFSLKFGTVEGLDEVLVALFRAPHSYTGEDAAEISCHASPFIVSSLLDRLTEAGCYCSSAPRCDAPAARRLFGRAPGFAETIAGTDRTHGAGTGLQRGRRGIRRPVPAPGAAGYRLFALPAARRFFPAGERHPERRSRRHRRGAQQWQEHPAQRPAARRPRHRV